MEKELQSAIDNRVKSQVMDGLLEVTEVDVPNALVDDECGRMRQNMVQQFGVGSSLMKICFPKNYSQRKRRSESGLGSLSMLLSKQNR